MHKPFFFGLLTLSCSLGNFGVNEFNKTRKEGYKLPTWNHAHLPERVYGDNRMLNLPSFLPPTALSPPTTIIPSLRRVTPCSSGIKARKGISPKSGYDYESSYPSNFNTGYFLSFAAVRNSIAVNSIASLTTAYS